MERKHYTKYKLHVDENTNFDKFVEHCFRKLSPRQNIFHELRETHFSNGSYGRFLSKTVFCIVWGIVLFLFFFDNDIS